MRITQFEDKFCGEIKTIYSIDNAEPLKAHSSVTTSEKCPHCAKRNIFRLYDSKAKIENDTTYEEIYDCICPNCNKMFDITIEDAIY